jgi:hypothetical protein
MRTARDLVMEARAQIEGLSPQAAQAELAEGGRVPRRRASRRTVAAPEDTALGHLGRGARQTTVLKWG